MKKLLVACLLTVTASAGFLVEPYLGFGFTSGDFKGNDNTSYDISTSGVTMGARVGYTMLGFMGGLDYSMATESEWEFEASSTDKYDIKRSNLGVFAGYELPILLRAWVGYDFMSKAEGDSDDGALSFEGGATKFGVGFTGLPFVSLNLEYKMFSYDDNKLGSTKLTNKLEVNEVLLSVSLPLDL